MNDLESAICSALPGLDCGACGYADGCRGYARSLVRGNTDLGLCPVGGQTLRLRLSEILEDRETSQRSQVAVIACLGDPTISRQRFHYSGVDSCRAAAIIYGGPKECLYGCLGLGDCLQACPYGAISWSGRGFPKVDFAKCRGCGRCVDHCPKDIIMLVPRAQQILMACSNQGLAEGLPGRCRAGCTSCAVCIEACPYGAIYWHGSLPQIDYARCRSCSICVYKCPSKTFIDRIPIRPTAFIGLQCNGCQMCKVVCPTDCIVGKKGDHHKVMRGQCIGCGQCYEVCPVRAVTMLGALGHVNLSQY